MWQKVRSWAFMVVLVGYVLALSVMAIHDWMEDPPSWAAPKRPAVAEVLQPRPPQTDFDVYPMIGAIPAGTNWQTAVRRVQLSWKTSMTIAPTTRVNSEEISQSHASMGTNFHDPWWKLWQ